MAVAAKIHFPTCPHLTHDSWSAGFAFGKSVLKTKYLEKLNSTFLHSHATVSQNKVFTAFWKSKSNIKGMMLDVLNGHNREDTNFILQHVHIQPMRVGLLVLVFANPFL